VDKRAGYRITGCLSYPTAIDYQGYLCEQPHETAKQNYARTRPGISRRRATKNSTELDTDLFLDASNFMQVNSYGKLYLKVISEQPDVLYIDTEFGHGPGGTRYLKQVALVAKNGTEVFSLVSRVASTAHPSPSKWESTHVRGNLERFITPRTWLVEWSSGFCDYDLISRYCSTMPPKTQCVRLFLAWRAVRGSPA